MDIVLGKETDWVELVAALVEKNPPEWEARSTDQVVALHERAEHLGHGWASLSIETVLRLWISAGSFEDFQKEVGDAYDAWAKDNILGIQGIRYPELLWITGTGRSVSYVDSRGYTHTLVCRPVLLDVPAERVGWGLEADNLHKQGVTIPVVKAVFSVNEGCTWEAIVADYAAGEYSIEETKELEASATSWHLISGKEGSEPSGIPHLTRPDSVAHERHLRAAGLMPIEE